MSNVVDDKLMNVLVIAYACEPNEPSEPGVGWNMVHEIADFANVTVITRSNNREVIECAEAHERIAFEYVDFGNILKKLKKSGLLGIQAYFMLWQWLAYRKANKLSKNTKYDVLHQLTFGVARIAPPVFLTNLPFIWGPVGGGDRLPSAVTKALSFNNRLKEFIYASLKVATYISPFAAYARYRSKHILFRTNSSIGSMPKFPAYPISVMCETATNEMIIEKTNHALNEAEVQFLAVGRLIYGKGVINAVYAFGEYIKQGGKAKFVLLGDGVELEAIKTFINDNGFSDQIVLKGNVAHEEVEAELLKSDVLLHPSFREGGSWSIMEGLIYGLPVVCLNTSGPADMVDAHSGILIEAENNEQIIRAYAQAITLLATDHDRRIVLSQGAQNRIENHYRWEQRGEVLKCVYQEVAMGGAVNTVLEH